MIDPYGSLTYSEAQSREGAIHVSDKLVKTLETKVNDLIELSTELKLENQALKKRLTDLQHEKRDLLERHRLAGDYIDRSINRLKLAGEQSVMRQHTVTIDILDKSYQVACEPEQEEELRQAARDLDDQMRAIRSTGKVIGLERVAIMAALNLSHQVLSEVRRAAGRFAGRGDQRHH